MIDDLIKAYEDHIKLLGEELDELAPIAYAHGWKSKRYEKGKLLHERIQVLKAVVAPLITCVKIVLLRQVGDNRECSHCGKSFIPNDNTSHDALEMYRELKKTDNDIKDENNRID